MAESARLILSEVKGIVSEIAGTSGGRFAGKEASVRVVSALAEGADRLVAQAALDLGLEFQCPLPFQQAEYERVFETEESRSDYRRLLDLATEVVELHGQRTDEGAAYLNAGRVLLERSDLLIAVWDGGKAAGRGGTAEIVSEARERGIPVLHVPSGNPHSISLLGEDAAVPWREALRARLI